MTYFADNSQTIGKTPLVRLAKKPEYAGKTIMVVLPDVAERYLSSALFEGVFDEKGLPA